MEQAITDMIRQCTAAMESMNTMMGGMMAGAPGAMSASGGPTMAGDGWSLALAAVGVALAVGLTLVIVGTRGRRASSTPEDAREELDWRYARGEIARETYLQRRTDLVAGAAR